MHGWTLIVLAVVALVLGGIALGGYLVAADRLYSRDKQVSRRRGKEEANPRGADSLATGAAQDQSRSDADPQKKP